MSCRTSQGWSAPAFLTLEKGSMGVQIGAESTDVVLLVMNDRGIDRLLQDKVTLGGDASIAAGPVGRSGTAATDAQLTAEMLSYSRARGLFAGIDLSGGVLRPDNDADKALYGRSITAREILMAEHGPMQPPASTRSFMTALNSVSRQSAEKHGA
jgi:lipid-binding SYLF domain-containing protein